MRTIILLSLLWAGAAAAPATALVRRVPAEYATINAALDASVAGDTVLVAPGTYDEYETREWPQGFLITSVAFLTSDVVLRSEGGPTITTLRIDDVVSSPTICKAFEVGGTASIEGFTFTGTSTGLSGVQFTYSGRCIIRDCKFLDFGSGGSSGGVAVASVKSDLEVYACEFHGIDGTNGAGIAQTSSTLIAEDCEFRNIRSGAVSLTFDAGYPHATGLTMRRCKFYDNEKTTGTGGAIAVNGYSSVLIEDCWFEENRSVGSSDGGGAIQTSGTSSDQVIRDCTFVNNWVADGNGGGVRIHCRTLVMTGNTFYGNHQEIDWPTGGSAVYLNGGSTYLLANNVIVGSLGEQAVGISSGTLTAGCNVYWNNPQGHTSGFSLDATDVVADPMFCDVEGGDFTVNAASPCLPENNPVCEDLIGAWDQGCGGISVEAESWGRVKNLYRAEPEGK